MAMSITADSSESSESLEVSGAVTAAIVVGMSAGTILLVSPLIILIILWEVRTATLRRIGSDLDWLRKLSNPPRNVRIEEIES